MGHDTVKALVGNAASFDYQERKEIPALDLPVLRPFFDAMLVLNGRRPMWKDDRLTFKPSESWNTRTCSASVPSERGNRPQPDLQRCDHPAGHAQRSEGTREREPKEPVVDREAVETRLTQGLETLTGALSELR